MRYMWDTDSLYLISRKLNNQLDRVNDQVKTLERVKSVLQSSLQGSAGDEFQNAIQENVKALNEFGRMIEEQTQMIRKVVKECYEPYEDFLRAEISKLESQQK